MTSDQLSKRLDREFHKALASVVLTTFPNPDRKDCPDFSVLKAIANKRISMRDPALSHTGMCSPCFAQLTGIRNDIQRAKALWSIGAAAAVVLLAITIGYFGLNSFRSPTLAPQQIAATLDLRSASASRSVQVPELNQEPIEIPRGALTLTVNLPIGSEPGSYETQIRRDSEVIVSGTGQAEINNGLTQFSITLDTRRIPQGRYQFAWRSAQFEWSYYPIQIR